MKQTRKVGRTTKLTPWFLMRVVQLAARGLSHEEICKVANVAVSTIWTWKRLHPQFQKAYQKGIALGIERRLARIEKAGRSGQWTADAWYLERVYPERFGRREAFTMDGSVAIAAQQRIEVVVLNAVPQVGNGDGNGGPKAIEVDGIASPESNGDAQEVKPQG